MGKMSLEEFKKASNLRHYIRTLEALIGDVESLGCCSDVYVGDLYKYHKGSLGE